AAGRARDPERAPARRLQRSRRARHRSDASARADARRTACGTRTGSRCDSSLRRPGTATGRAARNAARRCAAAGSVRTCPRTSARPALPARSSGDPARAEAAAAAPGLVCLGEGGGGSMADALSEAEQRIRARVEGALAAEERERISRALREDLIGLGAIAERMLSDAEAQEWMVNAPTRVFRDTGERIERVPDLVFKDDRQVRAFLERLLEQVEGKRLDRITPRVEARLPDGSRLTAAIPPVSSNGHPICTIRRFRLRAG